VDWLDGEVTTSIINLVVGSGAVAASAHYGDRIGTFVRPWADIATAHGRYIGRYARMVVVFFSASKPSVDLSTGSGSPGGHLDTAAGGWRGFRPPVAGDGTK
jgi:hypothetical protein